MTIWSKLSRSKRPPSIDEIHMAPAHLIRRCHQISVALFADELGQYNLTPNQYAALLAIRDRPGLDQRSLGNLIAIDRSAIATLLKGLEASGLISRTVPKDNLRVKQLSITSAGERLLLDTVREIAKVQQRILAPLSEKEQDAFMTLLSRLVNVNNEFSRAPLRIDD